MRAICAGSKYFLSEATFEDLVDLGFPIAFIADDGSVVIAKPFGAAVYVDEMNVRAQSMYEIHDIKCINPSVCAEIEHVRIENPNQKNRDRVRRAVGSPLPPTTNTIVVAIGGRQAEATLYMNRLDLERNNYSYASNLRTIRIQKLQF